MQLQEKISIENFNEKTFKIRLVEAQIDTEPAFTHYLHNHKNGVSQSYKSDALKHVKSYLDYRFEEDKFDNIVAEEALQSLLFVSL